MRRLCSSRDQTVRLWSLPKIQGDGTFGTAREIKVYRGHTGLVTGLAFSPVDPILASSSDDRTIRLWQLPDSLPW